MSVAKTKALISCAATAQLICVPLFSHIAKRRVFHEAAQMTLSLVLFCPFRESVLNN